MNYLNFILQPIGILVGCSYPFYASFKALDAKSQDATAAWLTYWTVYAILTVFECLFSFILKWFSVYYTLKIGLVLWLQLPQTKGALILYWKYLQPQLKKHEDQIDLLFVEGRKKAQRFKDWPSTMVNRTTTAADKVLQELEEGDIGEKGE